MYNRKRLQHEKRKKEGIKVIHFDLMRHISAVIIN
jgi:hypothetical protein